MENGITYYKFLRRYFPMNIWKEWGHSLKCFLRLNFKSNLSLTLKIVSATTIMGLLRTWAKAKTWISSRLSYIILDDVLEPLEAVDDADEDSPWESKSLELGRLTMLSLDLLLWEFDSEELKDKKCNWFHVKYDCEENFDIFTLCYIHTCWKHWKDVWAQKRLVLTQISIRLAIQPRWG